MPNTYTRFCLRTVKYKVCVFGSDVVAVETPEAGVTFVPSKPSDVPRGIVKAAETMKV